MGVDKAFLVMDGKALFERAADTLSAVCGSVKIVGLRVRYDGSLTVIDDVEDRRGSIIGLYTALKNCRSEFTAVLACDLPFVESEMMSEMAGLIQRDEYLEAIVPRQMDGRLQQLCAIYRSAACLPLVERMLAENNFRLNDLTAQLDIRIYEPSGDDRWSTNVNTPAELRSAIALDDESV